MYLFRLLAVIGQHALARRADPGTVALQAGKYREYVVLILGQLGLAELDDVGPASSAFCVVTRVWSRRLGRKLLRKRHRCAG
jgi:hypothetical protein